MSKVQQLNRRAFLRNAGMTALAGAIGSGSAAAAAPGGAPDPDSVDEIDFDRVYDRVGSNCYKWDRQIARFGADNIDVGMGIADMDFRAAPCITEAIAERCRHENWGYMSSTDSLKEAITIWSSERYRLDIDPDTIEIAAGVHPGLIAALHAFSPPGSRVLMNTPTYNGFYSDLRWTRTLKNENEMYLDDDGSYSIDWDDFEARMTPDTHAFLLCNPQNPTGNCWSEEDLLRMGELCLKHRIVVLADEIHCDFVNGDNKYVPFASLPDRDVVDNSLTFKAISKTFSLAAMKNAYFFSTNPVLLERVRWRHRADINTIGVVANEAAYRHGAAWFDRLRPYIDANHDYAETYLREHVAAVRYKKAQGTYLAWLDVGDLAAAIGAEEQAAVRGLQSPEHYVEQWLVERAHVQLNPGSNYGKGGANHMRMNLGAPRPLIEQGLNQIRDAVRRV